MAVMDNRLIGFPGKALAGSWEESVRLNGAQLGLWVFLATVTMLFAGFTSAIFVRRTALDWQPIPVPDLLWLNTAVLLTSSATLERARKFARSGGSGKKVRVWLLVTTVLGILFLIGQLGAWRQLVARGVYLAGNPHSSFFYVLTGTHGIHLLGGLAILAYLNLRAWLAPTAPPPSNTLSLCATYWHFLDGLWIYLFVMLFMI